MMSAGRERRAAPRLRAEAGFTLVELLVVLIIIGLLAAIAIPLFTTQQDKATDVQAKAGARLAQQAMEIYRDDNDTYAGADRSALEQIEPALVDAPNLGVVSAASTGYELKTVSVSKAPVTFTVKRNSDGTVDHRCTPGDVGGCGAGGTW